MALDSRIDYAFRRLAEYLQDTESWGAVRASILRSRPVAYFSAEFGLHESLPIYSGGLGVLAGDHLKSASDLGIPLIGVGLLVRPGLLSPDAGYQWLAAGALPERRPGVAANRERCRARTISRSWSRSRRRPALLHARVWRVEVGRTMLLLLDSNVPENSESDRSLTARLYGATPGSGSARSCSWASAACGALHALRIHPVGLASQ